MREITSYLMDEARGTVERMWAGEGWYWTGVYGSDEIAPSWYETSDDLLADTVWAMEHEAIRHTTAVYYLGESEEPDEL